MRKISIRHSAAALVLATVPLSEAHASLFCARGDPTCGVMEIVGGIVIVGAIIAGLVSRLASGGGSTQAPDDSNTKPIEANCASKTEAKTETKIAAVTEAKTEAALPAVQGVHVPWREQIASLLPSIPTTAAVVCLIARDSRRFSAVYGSNARSACASFAHWQDNAMSRNDDDELANPAGDGTGKIELLQIDTHFATGLRTVAQYKAEQSLQMGVGMAAVWDGDEGVLDSVFLRTVGSSGVPSVRHVEFVKPSAQASVPS